MLLAFKPLLHNPFLWKERKNNSFIAVIVLLVIASPVAPYSPLYHSTSPHPEWNIPCGADLLLPYIRLSAKSKRKSAKATNLKDSQYVVALHRDSKSGIMHLHIDANRIDIRGNVNDAHYIYERAMAAAAKVGQQRGWKLRMGLRPCTRSSCILRILESN